MPSWYSWLRAADRLQIPMPELLEHPDGRLLRDLALGAEVAETRAAEVRRKRTF